MWRVNYFVLVLYWMGLLLIGVVVFGVVVVYDFNVVVVMYGRGFVLGNDDYCYNVCML